MWDQQTLIRHSGLYARDLYELFGLTKAIPVNDGVTVRWRPAARHAVFHGLADRPVTVTEATLDDHGLVPEGGPR